jgi:hypothetical protein
MSGNSRAWKQMIAVSEFLKWPEIYRCDMYGDENYQDKAILSAPDAPAVFGWAIRSTGTDLYRFGGISNSYVAKCAENSGSGDRRYFWFDGVDLEAIEFDTFIQRLEKLPEGGISIQHRRQAGVRVGVPFNWVYSYGTLFIEGIPITHDKNRVDVLEASTR